MKSNLFILIFFALFFSCKQQKKEIYFDATNPVKPIITSKIPSSLLHSLKTNNNEVDVKKASNILSLYIIINDTVATNKIFGNYILKDDSLQFIPYFNLGYNLNFEAQLCIDGDTIKKRFSTPQAPVVTALPVQAIQIFPLTNKIPSNILLFHAIFSAPMNEDRMAFDKVQVLDETGKIKPKVWKEKSYWLDSAKHLVLMIHPGRIKRGIDYLKELGPVFEPGKKYTILLTTELKDQYGRPLQKEYRKTFTIIPPDRAIPKLLQTNFKKPKLNTQDPLQFCFSEPMDYGLVCTEIKVFNAHNQLVEGKFYPVNDMAWNFIPKQTWKNEQYTVEFNATIADLASNHLNRPFEVKDITAYDNKPIKWSVIPN